MKNTKAKNAFFLDFDNDRFQDILVVGQSQNSPYGRIQLFHNNSDGTFEETSYLLPKDLNGKEIVALDMDDDGDLDLVVLNGNWGSSA